MNPRPLKIDFFQKVSSILATTVGQLPFAGKNVQTRRQPQKNKLWYSDN